MSAKKAQKKGEEFAAAAVRWQKKHGRHNLPWQADFSPYKIWLSEVMLQQTQTAAVIPYYQNFLRRWPDAAALARATENAVLAAWSGLGYYARARNLLRAAKIIARAGFPQTAAEWQKLPGIGKSTAAAIAVFAKKERAAILDGNVKRVLARVFAVQTPPPNAEKELWALAESLLPEKNIRAYTQSLMDLGATVCVRQNPRCAVCPLAAQCESRRRGIANLLPRRPPPTPKPLKKTAMALVFCRGRVFLEKRPPSGIWGGLWSLPEAKTAAALKPQCEKRLAVKLSRRGEGEFFHAFTHYRLHARIFLWECAAEFSPAKNQKWLSRRAAKNAALPSPIKKYILACGFCR